MKNLKKVLALVLVVAMMASFATVSAAFPDADSINDDFTVAVDVLSGMGVIGGYTDGTFRPTNLVTRGAFAKMVSFVMNSGKNAAASYGASATLAFSDVDAASVLTPSIGYVVTKGYVDGYPDGTFRPSNNVTGLAAAKILLGALGIEGEYTGTGWGNRVLGAGEDAGLFVGMDNVDLTKNLTREAAAQMIWNAMNYSVKGQVVEYTVKDGTTVLYKGTDALTAVALKGAGYTVTTGVTTTDSIGAVKFGLKAISIPDDFGRKYTAYTNGKDGLEQVIYASYEPTAVLEYTTAISEGKLAAALGCTLTTDKVSITVITNGDAASAKDITKVDASTPVMIGGQGTLTQVYKTATKGAYEVVVVDTYVKTLAVGDVVAAVPASPTSDAVAAYIKVAGTPATPTDAGAYKTDAFKVGDVILYTATKAGKIVNVVKAESVSGSINAVGAANAYVRVDGTVYYEAAQNDGAFGTAPYTVSADKYTYYLDFYGNIIHEVKGEAAKVDTKYTYVIATAAKAATTVAGGDLFTTVAGSAAVAQAKVIDLATGEIKVVNLGVVKNVAGAYVYATATGAASTTPVTDATATIGALYGYTELADGSIVLTGPATLKTVSVQKNVATLATGLYANSATVINQVKYVEKAGAIISASVTTTTGMANFPAVAESLTGIVVSDPLTGIVSSITVVEKYVAPTATVNYAFYKGAGETDKDGTKVAFISNGAVVEYYNESGETFTTPGAVYDIAVSEGKLTGATPKTAANSALMTVVAVDNSYVLLASAHSVYTVNFAQTGYTVFNADANYVADVLEAGDKVWVYGATKNGLDWTGADMFVIDNV